MPVPARRAFAIRPESMDAAPHPPGGLVTRRVRGAIALSRVRLRQATGGRLALVLGALVAMIFAGIAIVLRVSDGADAPLAGLVATAAEWIAWLAGAPIALAAARDRQAIDRAEGIEALAAGRGVSAGALASARVLAAMIEVARAIGVPLCAIALIAAGLAGSGRVALFRVAVALGAAAFAMIAGVTLGGIAAACGRFGRARGRLLFATVILGPWMLADLAGRPAWSIPGALSAVLSFAMRAGGSGA